MSDPSKYKVCVVFLSQGSSMGPSFMRKDNGPGKNQESQVRSGPCSNYPLFHFYVSYRNLRAPVLPVKWQYEFLPGL